MTTELVSRRTVVVSWVLTSLCLRYDFAKPSVWLRRKACKPRQFNGFRSDYPLNLVCFGSRLAVFWRSGVWAPFWHCDPKVVVVSVRYPSLRRSLREILLATLGIVWLLVSWFATTGARPRLAVTRCPRRSLQNMPDGSSRRHVLYALLRANVARTCTASLG